VITIAPPTEAQRTIARAWLRKAFVRARSQVRFGDVSLVGPGARAASRAAAETIDAISLMLVACLDDVPGEPVGFVAWSPATDVLPVSLHWVFVLGPDRPHGTRRLGIGTQLLREAVGDDPFRTTSSTPAGEALVAAYRRQIARAA
jgi:hypothetical protein